MTATLLGLTALAARVGLVAIANGGESEERPANRLA